MHLASLGTILIREKYLLSESSTHWDKCEATSAAAGSKENGAKDDKDTLGTLVNRLNKDKAESVEESMTRRRPPKKLGSQQIGSLQPWVPEPLPNACPCAAGRGYCTKHEPSVCRCLDSRRYAGHRCDLCQPDFTLVNEACVPSSPFAGVDGLVYSGIICIAVLFGCGIGYYRYSFCARSVDRMRAQHRQNLLEEFDIELKSSDIKWKKGKSRSLLSASPEDSESVLIDLVSIDSSQYESTNAALTLTWLG